MEIPSKIENHTNLIIQPKVELNSVIYPYIYVNSEQSMQIFICIYTQKHI